MRIIDRVDINYFRSIGTLSLAPCRDVNVLAGQNDAGKSNILKALNLFFNNLTDRDEEFDFVSDLNRGREEDARAAKGRMTVWIRIHFNNFLGWKSLPKRFSVKRSWNRYDERPTDNYPDNLPATTIGRFLNKIEYHYIPAVRDREIYGDLLADLHDTLVQDESIGLRQSSAAFVENLDGITSAMSERILDRLKIDSKVNLPGDLQDFFRALDFSTGFNDFRVPLSKRGDGIQGRHIPFILDYISEKSSKYHIWGYEEPENSLELTRAFDMADDFKNQFSKDNQIFLTTHSPAFYDITGANSSRWLVESVVKENRLEPRLQVISDNELPDKSLGLVAVMAPRIKEMNESYQIVRNALDEMSVRVANAEAPVVFVEGPTDVAILAHAKQVLGFGDDNYRIESANGASEITGFLKQSTRVKPDDRPLIGVYDGDATGRREFERNKASHKVENTEVRILDKGKRVYATILPTPEHLEEAERILEEKKGGIPLCIEFMFDRQVLGAAVEQGSLVLKPRTTRLALDELPLEISLDQIEGIPEHYKYLLKEVDQGCKPAFAQWIVQRDAQDFEPFRALFADIRAALA